MGGECTFKVQATSTSLRKNDVHNARFLRLSTTIRSHGRCARPDIVSVMETPKEQKNMKNQYRHARPPGDVPRPRIHAPPAKAENPKRKGKYQLSWAHLTRQSTATAVHNQVL